MSERFIRCDVCGDIVPEQAVFLVLRVPGHPDGLHVCGGLCLAKWQGRKAVRDSMNPPKRQKKRPWWDWGGA